MKMRSERWQRNWLWLCPVLAVVGWFLPGWVDAGILDRRLLGSGELWRLLTFPIVHLSLSHLWVNTLVCAGLLWAGGPRWRGLAPVGLIVLVIGPGVGALLWEPELQRLAGLSALNVGLATWLGLEAWAEKERGFGSVCLGGVGLKLLVELLWVGGLVRYDGPDVRTCASCHGVALLVGWAVWVAGRGWRESAGNRQRGCSAA